MSNNIPVSVDYTSRDFYSLRADLIARVQSKLMSAGKLWSATDPADFGVAFVEAMAYVGDITSYYIDRMANEANLSTATQRQSLLNIADSYGYTPSGYKSAVVDITFTNSSATVEKRIPVGTTLTTEVVTSNSVTPVVLQLDFTLQEEVVVPAGGTPVVGTAIHGKDVSLLADNAANPSETNDIPGEFLGVSDGTAGQTFTLSSNQVSEGSVKIYVKNGDYYQLWDIVTHITDYGPTDAVVSLKTDANNIVSVIFGNGVSGAIPTYGEKIKATYVVGGGIDGNIEVNHSFTVTATPASSGITVASLSTVTGINDTAAYGGENPESNDSIRTNAPEALRTLTRAVTLADFKSLALSVDGVGKAAAYASSPNSVLLYVAPITSDTSSDYYPGMDSTNTVTTSVWDTLKSSVNTYFADKTQIGATVTVVPPIYTNVMTTIEYTPAAQYTDDQVVAAIKYGVIYGYGFNFLDFNKVIYPEDIEASLVAIPSVRSVRVTKLYESGGTAARNTLVATNGEYYVFKSANLTIYPVAGLSALTISTGTLSPTFSSSVFSYTASTTSTSMTVTPTVANSTSTVTVNGTTVTSGSASGSISLSLGVNTILIAVTSADATVTRTYTLKVTRS